MSHPIPLSTPSSKDEPDYYHTHVHLVYRQKEKVDIGDVGLEETKICGNDKEWRDKRVKVSH